MENFRCSELLTVRPIQAPRLLAPKMILGWIEALRSSVHAGTSSSTTRALCPPGAPTPLNPSVAVALELDAISRNRLDLERVKSWDRRGITDCLRYLQEHEFETLFIDDIRKEMRVRRSRISHVQLAQLDSWETTGAETPALQLVAFTVQKKNRKGRLVIDARPLNKCQRRQDG
jgi:hypothetical protein